MSKAIVCLLFATLFPVHILAENLGSCPTVLVLFPHDYPADYALSLVSQHLIEGGANLIFAEEAKEVTERFVVQFHQVLTNTRSGKMRFSYKFQGSGFSEKQLAETYTGMIAATERATVGRGVASYSAAAMSAKEYTEFKRQTGYVCIDYGEEVEYQNWYNQLITDEEQRMFWEKITKWNADVIVLGTLNVVPVGSYGGIYSSRAIASIRVIDTRNEPPSVLKSFAVVVNGVDLSEEAANQRVVQVAAEQIVAQLSDVIPCYQYLPPEAIQPPLGAVGFAVLDVQASSENQENADAVARLLEAALSKYPEIALYTRRDLEKVLAEQKIGLTGLIENPVEVGRLSGVRYIFIGQITECEYQDQHYYIDFPILNYLQIIVRSMRAGLSLTLLDAQTGQILWSAEKTRTGWGISVFGLEINMSILDQFRYLVDELVREFYTAIIKS